LNRVAAEGIRKWLTDPDTLPLLSGISPEEVTSKFVSRWLCFEPHLVSYPFIDTRFNLLHGDVIIGYYRLISLLSGEIDDDYFVLEPHGSSA